MLARGRPLPVQRRRARPTGHSFCFSPDFGFADYVEWALDVPMYFVIRDGHYHDMTHMTFR